MAAKHGTNGVFKLYSGSLRDISNYLELAGIKRAIDTAETSGLGDAAKEYIPGLSDATISGNGQFDVTLDGYIDVALAAQSTTAPTWEYFPGGNTTGQPKYSGSCLITKWDTESKIDDKVTCELELQVTGAITRAIV